jgi:hypothetical protein
MARMCAGELRHSQVEICLMRTWCTWWQVAAIACSRHLALPGDAKSATWRHATSEESREGSLREIFGYQGSSGGATGSHPLRTYQVSCSGSGRDQNEHGHHQGIPQVLISAC